MLRIVFVYKPFLEQIQNVTLITNEIYRNIILYVDFLLTAQFLLLLHIILFIHRKVYVYRYESYVEFRKELFVHEIRIAGNSRGTLPT